MEVIKSKMIHVNSKIFANQPAQDEVKVIFPGNEFTKKDDNEEHRLTLVGFNCRRNFYSVNATNNTFYSADNGNNQLNVFIIPEGDYTYVELAAAIQTVVAAVHAGATVTYGGSINNYLTFSMGGSTGWVNTNYFYSLEKDGQTNVILGGKASVPGTKVPLFSTDGAGTYTSQFALTLFSDNELFLNASLQSNNFSTNGSNGRPLNGKLVNSQLFGRIPITDLNSEELKNVKWITYSDSNNNYQIYSQSSALGNIIFQVTDSQGRSIKNLHQSPSDDKNLAWTAMIKYELLRKKTTVETLLGCFNDKLSSQLIDPRQDHRFP